MTWKSIETAPRDGTLILVKAENGSISLAAWSDKIKGPGVSNYIQKPGWMAWANGKEIDDEGWDTGAGYTLELKNDDSPIEWIEIPANNLGNTNEKP